MLVGARFHLERHREIISNPEMRATATLDLP
jgi:hypothetical protein